ncbi:MAG: phosphoenolpyruvate--protein phosphotransferase [Deltaproteobacteria bacterium]|jgi:phosphotransferase system enzyme I (PtsI)|nr:phosphoenolpyruvate--protein phosphotransferase [Deltaproteobacteria bacterium]
MTFLNASPPAETDIRRRSILSGIAVSSGVAVGRSLFINRRLGFASTPVKISAKKIPLEEERLEEATLALVMEFEEAKRQLSSQSLGPAAREQADLLDAYILICRDPKMLALALDMIRRGRVSAEWAWERAVQSVVGAFEKMDSPYLRERAEDVRAVGSRILARLRGESHLLPAGLEKCIIFAHDLTPADTLALTPESVIGLATEMGGHTSHTGILARSLRLPCVVGVTGLEEAALDGAQVIVDGIQGLIIVNPGEPELLEYAELQKEFSRYEDRIRQEASLPAETVDGIRAAVYGNIEVMDEAAQIRLLGGEGIGLYRTEYSYMARSGLPSEDELYAEYARVVEIMSPAPVVLRTLDVGADKSLGGGRLEEENPALGLRAIRYSLRHQDIFRRQLRAILRAGSNGRAAIMFPLISGLLELRQAKSVLGEVRQELDNQGIAYDKDMAVGTMIELPSAVFQARALAAETDFFSIGTNDLIQYTLGIDRGNKYVSYLYQPLHPAVLQAIRLVVDAAHAAGITVCVCGEMASDPYCLPILLAMGVDEFSVNPQAIPIIKYMIRNFDTAELGELLRQVYNSSSVRTITRLVKHHIHDRFRTELHFINLLNDTDL